MGWPSLSLLDVYPEILTWTPAAWVFKNQMINPESPLRGTGGIISWSSERFDADRNKLQQCYFPSASSSVFAFALSGAADAVRVHIASRQRKTVHLLSLSFPVHWGSSQSPCGAVGWQDAGPQSPASPWCARIMLQSAKLGRIIYNSPSHLPPSLSHPLPLSPS